MRRHCRSIVTLKLERVIPPCPCSLDVTLGYTLSRTESYEEVELQLFESSL